MRKLPYKSVCALKKPADKQQLTVDTTNLTCGDTTFEAPNGWSMEMSSLSTMEVTKYLET